MVKLAKTDTDKKRVFEYLKSKNLVPATNTMYFTEDERGEITGAYGIEIKFCIEPLQADNKFITNELWIDAKATARTLGQEKISILTAKDEVAKHLVENENGIEWGKNLKEIFIMLNQ